MCVYVKVDENVPKTKGDITPIFSLVGKQVWSMPEFSPPWTSRSARDIPRVPMHPAIWLGNQNGSLLRLAQGP
jgi:hypothetical protein